MSVNQVYIAQLCDRIAAGGKVPSVALIKGQADRPLALPEVISVLHKWKQDPAQFSSASEDATSEPPHLPAMLDGRVTALEEEVARLKTALTTLLDSKK